MKQCLPILTFACILLVAVGIRRLQAQSQSAIAAPKLPAAASQPAKGGAEKLLLLDEAPAERSENQADNSRCEVCHLNLAMEELVMQHAKANVGCAKCHGDSDDHIADESWASGGNGTAPQRIFKRARINPMCLECHAPEKLTPKEHKAPLAGVGDKTNCVDCHGKHRIVNRKCKWK